MTLISLSLDIWTIEIGKPEEQRGTERNVMGIRAGRQTVSEREQEARGVWQIKSETTVGSAGPHHLHEQDI